MSLEVLQFGTTGQLARELIAQAPAWPVTVTALSRADVDFLDPEKAAREVYVRKPDLVINAVAYTAVDKAESDIETCYEVNAETPAAIAGMCGHAGPAMIHVSSDYVFDGTKGSPYIETDDPSPLGVYGRMKLSGEQMVMAGCARSMVVRASWVVSAHGSNFIKTMLRLADEGKPLRVVDDQWGRPTAAADLAGFILSQAERLAAAPLGDPAFGLVHYANAGETTWRRLAEAVMEEAYGRDAPPVTPITTAEYPTPAKRPVRGTLDTTRLSDVFGVTPRPWRAAVAEIVRHLKVAA